MADKTDALEQCIEDHEAEWPGGKVFVAKCRAQLAAMTAAQPMTVDQAEQVLPSGEWVAEWYYVGDTFSTIQFRNDAEINAYIDVCTLGGFSHDCGDGITSRDQRDAAEVLFAAMQGDSPEAVALRERYAG
jgi:hypothetical protein